jgi:YjbE family integral membrane protein
MIDLGWLGYIEFSWKFILAVGSIVLIDLVLAGDNAVVIAMAVKNLQGKKRTLGIMLGSGGAVVVRVACTFVVAQLLNMQYIKLIGGAVIIWIAVKLLTEGAEEEHAGKEVHSLWQALWVIIVADLSMGIDNMLAVGAASHGNLFLGAALLGKVGGEMMATDPFVVRLFDLPHWAEYVSMAVFVVFVCGFSKWILNRKKAKGEPEIAHGGNGAVAVEAVKAEGVK